MNFRKSKECRRQRGVSLSVFAPISLAVQQPPATVSVERDFNFSVVSIREMRGSSLSYRFLCGEPPTPNTSPCLVQPGYAQRLANRPESNLNTYLAMGHARPICANPIFNDRTVCAGGQLQWGSADFQSACIADS